MIIIAAIVKALVAAGGSAAQVEAVIQAAEEAIEAQRLAAADRKRVLARDRKRAERARKAGDVTHVTGTTRDTDTPLYDEADEMSRNVTGTNVTQRGSPSPPPEETSTPPPLTPPETTPRRVLSDPSAPPKKANGKKPKAKPTKRCPAKWKPSEHVFEVAETEGFTAEQRDREFAKMRDHEFGVARKDWDAVACNWLRRAAESGLASGHGPPNGRPLTAAERAQAEEQEGLRRFREREALREKASVAH